MNPFTIPGDNFHWYAYFQGRKYRFRTLAEATSFLAHAPTFSRGLLAQFTSFELTAEELERFDAAGLEESARDVMAMIDGDRPPTQTYREAMIDAGRGHLLRGDE